MKQKLDFKILKDVFRLKALVNLVIDFRYNFFGDTGKSYEGLIVLNFFQKNADVLHYLYLNTTYTWFNDYKKGYHIAKNYNDEYKDIKDYYSFELWSYLIIDNGRSYKTARYDNLLDAFLDFQEEIIRNLEIFEYEDILECELEGEYETIQEAYEKTKIIDIKEFLEKYLKLKSKLVKSIEFLVLGFASS